jgi:diguanylate cyclase (GGDEF)-like protein
VAGVLGLASALPGPDWQSALLYELGVWLSVVVIWATVVRLDVLRRRPWAIVALAVTLWAVGDLAWDALTLTGSQADVSVADLLYLLGYIVFAAGVLVMLRRRPTGRREALLDGTAFASAAAVLIWIALARPQSNATADWQSAVVLAAYPLMDALLIAALLWLILTPGGDSPSQRVLVGSMIAMAVVDASYAAFSRAGLDDWLALSNALYPAVYAVAALAVGLATASPVSAVRNRRARVRLHPARALLLGAALVLAPAGAAVSATSDVSVDRVALLAVTCAISIMVLTRFVNEAHARERIHLEALHLASHDPLTGLLNRRAFLSELDEQLERGPCALLYVDLDGFKWINDTSGHAAGDQALVRTALRLRDAVRDHDLVARLGGDEFAVCCPGLVDAGALQPLLERVRASLERIDPAITASVGAAVACPGPGASGALLKQADAAMYRAKRAGGNRIWTDLTALPA